MFVQLLCELTKFMCAKFHNDSLPTIRDIMFYWNFTKTAKAAILFLSLSINQLTWVPAANIPSPLKWKFEILPPVYSCEV